MRSYKVLLTASVLGLMGSAFFVGCGDDSSDGNGGSTGTASTGSAGETTELTGSITKDVHLTADKKWLIKGIVLVESGATVTIDAGTTVMGEAASKGTLVIKQGAKIVAVGTADKPIVFTSEKPVGQRAQGDWGGLVLLGKAPINVPGGTANVEGLEASEVFGGTDANDSSGQLSYVRVEFSGVELSEGNEINGITFGGVGKGTKIDHVMVKETLDDCFEFFGGTVDVKYLVCYRNGDDSFDTDNGYTGRLQFLFTQKDPKHDNAEDNGFEWDNDADASNNTPQTSPTVYNATMCGANATLAAQQYGMLLRRGAGGSISNTFFSGWEACVDLRDANTSTTIDHSICVGNSPENIAYAEDGSNMDTQKDDDGTFDDRGWFTNGDGDAVAGAVANCFGDTPDPRPAAMIPGGTPPNDGFFDATANYVGAFKDGSDNWMSGAWIDWAQN